jgi:hypothetical protein
MSRRGEEEEEEEEEKRARSRMRCQCLLIWCRQTSRLYRYLYTRSSTPGIVVALSAFRNREPNNPHTLAADAETMETSDPIWKELVVD